MKKILLLGSGLTSVSVIKYYNDLDGFKLTLSSNDKAEMERLKNIYKSIDIEILNLKDEGHLNNLISQQDIVISLLPYIFHPLIAKFCLKNSKNMVTASYISDELKSLNEDAKKKNIIILNEVGLDPGIDHMATMELKDKIENDGGKIIEYYSYCGGLINPENNDNFLGYKFSWSPIGVLRALRNNAKFLKNKKIHEIKHDNLLYHSEKFFVNTSLNLCSYPNRDSTKYKEIYGFDDNINTLIRGTLRFEGFVEILSALKSLNLLEEEKYIKDYNTFLEYIKDFTKNIKISDFVLNKIKKEELIKVDIEKDLLYKLLTVIFSNKILVKKLEENNEATNRANLILSGFIEVNFLNNKGIITDHKNKMNSLAELLKKTLFLKENDKDYIIMVHYFKVKDKNNNLKIIKSQMIKSGEEKGLSAMSLTVGLPAAIAAKNILNDNIKETGVHGPFKKSIYSPIIKELKELNLFCEEKVIHFLPKL